MILAFLTFSLFLSGCVSFTLFPQKMPLREKTVQGTAADKILVVSISGVISEGKDGAVWDRDDDLVARIKEELTLAAEDEHIKALLLRINSPGGTVTASDIIYHEIMAFKEKRKVPVVAVIMDLGASGGYYIAVTGDRIIAHPTSVTGSVGVIMLRVSAEGLLQKIGVEASAIKSGAKKDIGSPFRPMTEDERAIFQSMINGFFSRFLDVVSKGRSLPADQLKVIADGRVNVADHGPGVPIDQQERIFERFWRGRDVETTGVGLGLAIVKKIMEAHRGAVEVRNNSGLGSIFTLTFPPADRT